MKSNFRRAKVSEISQIWSILQGAIERRKLDGSDQWQDGYPNQELVKKDIQRGIGYVLLEGESVIGYTAIILNYEPDYDRIDGKWLTDQKFVAIHRVAISENYLCRGFAKMILGYVEEFALKHHIYSIKADTNFDNPGMINIFEQLGYAFCGEIFIRESARKAYEKVLKKPS